MRNTINIKRLMDTFRVSNEVGKVRETGIQRLALTKEDKIMRDIFTGWLREENLEVRVDDLGNIYGRREGVRNDLSPVMVGSHLDTQLFGGRYDGILGVLSALEVIRVLNDHKVQTLRPVEIVNFTNEEGVRFAPPTLGSGVITGHIPEDAAYQARDEEGNNFLDELKKIGYFGSKENRASDVFSYIELHIEQGPFLEQQNASIGIVEGDMGIDWLTVTVTGASSHASSTPMKGRKDALLKTSEMIMKVNEAAKKLMGDQGTITFGKLHLTPNTILCIPEEVTFTISICHQENSLRNQLIEQIREIAAAIINHAHMQVEIESILSESSVKFSEQIENEIKTVVQDLGYSSMNITSAGGHDANLMLNIAPTGMIFIPCRNGISHSVEEYASESDIEKGANVLLNTVVNLANKRSFENSAEKKSMHPIGLER